MNTFLEQELRGLIAGCPIQIKALRNDLEIASGTAIATNVALHGLIAALPDLDLAARALVSVRQNFAGTAAPASSAEAAVAFDQTFVALQQTIENRKRVLAREAQSPQ